MIGNRDGSEMEGRRRPSRRWEGARPRATGRRNSAQCDPGSGAVPGQCDSSPQAVPRQCDLAGPGNHSGSGKPGPPDDPQPAHRLGPVLSQKLAPRQAAIAQPALRIEDLQLSSPAGRPIPIPRNSDLSQLPDHIPPQPNPGAPAQFQPQGGYLGQSAGQSRWKVRRLQNEQLDAGPAGQRSQPAESLRQSRGRNPGTIQRSRLQVQQQQVDCSILEEHRRHRQRLLERSRRQDDQPVQLDATSHGFDRIQAPGQIQIGHDPACRLGMGRGLQRERRLAARPIAVQSGGRCTRQPAQSEDRIQSSKTGGYRSIVRRRRQPRHARQIVRIEYRDPSRGHSQCPHDLAAPARSCPTPAFPEGRQSRLDVRGRGGHGTHIIERMFYQSSLPPSPASSDPTRRRLAPPGGRGILDRFQPRWHEAGSGPRGCSPVAPRLPRRAD